MKSLLILACFVGFCFANAEIDKLANKLKESCDNGTYKDCFELAIMYDNNPFSVHMHDKDKAAQYYNKSLQLLEKNCLNGDAEKCIEIGSIYLRGVFDIKKDSDKAYAYFKKGCFDLKNGGACYMAGAHYKSLNEEEKTEEFNNKSCELQYSLCLYERQYEDLIKQKQ
jgi:TPR repeat protein